MNQRRLVGAGVVENHVDVPRGWDRLVDRVEELPELDRAMPAVEGADDGAGFGVERGKQGRRAVRHVIMRAPFDLAGPHRQQRLGPVERLDLTLLVHTQDQRPIRGVQISPTMSRTFSMRRVFRELERLGR